jgi:hypothetical protein
MPGSRFGRTLTTVSPFSSEEGAGDGSEAEGFSMGSVSAHVVAVAFHGPSAFVCMK